MKRIISILLLLAICLSVFAGCKKDKGGNSDKDPSSTTEKVESDLPSAKAYLENMYQTAGKDEIMVLATDLDVLSVVAIGGVSYTIEWSVSITEGPSDSVKIGESSKENHVLLDIDESPENDILFTATATIKDAAGETLAVSFDYKISASATAGLTDEEIVEMAYALAEGEMMEGSSTLTGEIKMIKTAYDESYQNITVIIQIGELTDKRIECYRLTGEGCADLAIGDTITVTGILKNYNGTIEFDAGCVLDNVVKGEAVTVPTDPKEIVAAAYELAEGDALPYTATLTGVIASIDTPYDEGYQNITVTMTIEGCEDKPILVYRLKGEGAAELAAGDTITVTGYIVNYRGTIEYTAGCILDSVVKGDGEVTPVEKPDSETGIVDAAYALAEGKSLPYKATLTGKVTKINDAYDSEYGNITVTMTVSGREKKPIVCYRLKGSGVDKIAVGDTITVTGTLKNYNGTIEFDFGCTLDKRVSGGGTPVKQETDPLKIIDLAYKLAEGAEMEYDVTLTGKVTKIDTAYDSNYKNISVVITVSGRESKPILCYRLKGDGVDKVAVGDTLTVTGRLKNHYGTIEFDYGCTLDKRVSGGGTVVKQETDPLKIIDIAYKLAEGAEMEYDVTLTGKVTEIVDAYDSEYQNITVIMKVTGRESKPIKCYHLKGTGVDKIAVNDTITVTGRLKNYYGEVEFDNGCTLDKRVSGGGTAIKQETDPLKIVDIAYKLAEGAQMEYDVTLTGKIVELNTPYDSEYKNMTVTIAVSGRESKPIECYRMKGDKVSNDLCVGDTITVTGRLKNYSGTVEFDSGCTLDKVTSGGTKKPTDPKKIVDAAFALEGGESLKYFATLTGTVKSIDTEYSTQYKNITITIVVEGTNGEKDLVCYRLKGDGADKIKVGDTVTVTGVIKNYVSSSSGESTIEFDAGCTLG